ncbi:hypothetical protein MKX03_016708 [Papaver bracteatum]|nr:hypothetical protein MKX03_016708 [Papaver bracteatum]
MPIGVPKVPFRIPGEEDSVWVDNTFLGQQVDSEIANQLMGLMIYLTIEDDTKDVYLFINSPDVHTICMGLAASMGSFVLVGGEITKHLAFPHAWRFDFSVTNFFVFTSHIRGLFPIFLLRKNEINIESNGTIIVFFNSSERKGGKWIIYRSGFDRSSTLGKSRFHSRAVCNAQKMPVRVMIHQPASSFYEAQIGEFVLEAEELLKLRETLTRVYVQRTGNPLWFVSEDMERDVFMSPFEILRRVALWRAQYDESCKLCSGGNYCLSLASMVESIGEA